MDIKKLVAGLCKKYGTRDPASIAMAMDYIIICYPLVGGVRGFYQHFKRCKIIYILDSLNEHDANFVLAHELGHSILHRNMNRIFMEKHTHMIPERYEIEADRFAVELLFDDADLCAFMNYPISDVAKILGIREDLAEYRMMSIDPCYFQSGVVQ